MHDVARGGTRKGAALFYRRATFMSSAVLATDASTLLTFATAYAAMLVTPGPSFAVVSEASLSGSRQAAALVVVGVACGASLLIMLVLGGAANMPLHENSPQIGRYMGAVVLLIIGFRAFRRSWLAADVVFSSRQLPKWGGHFALGLVAAVTNPISFAFFSSVALESQSSDLFFREKLLPLGVFLMALCWFGFLAMLLSLPLVKTIYDRAGRRLDAVVGAVLIATALAWIAVPR
jgi:threonine/homoserine/homoserine lactone efflux protein